MPIKFLVLGGVFGVLGGEGGSADYIFMGARIFLIYLCTELIWAVTWGGGAKHMGGGKHTRERALPKIFGPLQKSFWSALSCTDT